MIILTAAVVGSAILFILAPLLGWGATDAFEKATDGSTRRAELMSQRQEILASLADLEFEFEVGKLTKEDFERTRERLTQQAVEIYRQMDAHAAS